MNVLQELITEMGDYYILKELESRKKVKMHVCASLLFWFIFVKFLPFWLAPFGCCAHVHGVSLFQPHRQKPFR